MKKELEMTILPSFCEENCAIIFSVNFKLGNQNIGEAIIYTCSEGYQPEDLQQNENRFKKKIAYIKDYKVMEEYKSLSLKNVIDFLKVIGIQNYMIMKENVQHKLEFIS